MSDTDAGLGKVVVNRSMSLDGFIAGPDHAMDWVIEYFREDPFPEVMPATGAMLIGRGTHEVAKRMSDEDTDYDGGPVFVLTHRPPDEPDQGVTFLTCDLAAASSTRSWCMSCQCCSVTACASRPRASAGSTWNRSATRSRVP